MEFERHWLPFQDTIEANVVFLTGKMTRVRDPTGIDIRLQLDLFHEVPVAKKAAENWA